MMPLVRGVMAAAAQPGRVEIVGALLDIGEHRRRADIVDAPRRRDESERRRDHLVAGPESGDHAADVQRRRAAVHAQRARIAKRGAERLLKILDVLAETETRGVVGGGERRQRGVPGGPGAANERSRKGTFIW